MGGVWDVALLRWMNHWPEWLAQTMVFFSTATNQLPIKIALGLLVVGLIAAGGNARVGAIVAMVSWPIANELTNLFKDFLPHARPFQELNDIVLRVGWSDSMGTASAHSANMAAVATALAWYIRPWGSIWIGVAVLTGVSRVYCGAHYPSQVLLGYACGVGVAMAVIRAWEAVAAKRSPKERAVGQESA